MRKLWLVVGLVSACAGAVTESGAQEDVLAVVSGGDGATELVLLNEQVVFRFTEAGARQIERQVMASAGDDAAWSDRTIRASVSGGIRGMRMAFPVADIREIRYSDGNLILHFMSRPTDAVETDERGRFEYQAVSEPEAVRFMAAFRRISSRTALSPGLDRS